MAAGNLLLSSSILLTGATYTRMAAFADILRLQFMSEKTFGDIQREYLFPAINDFWLKEQDLIFEELGDRDLWLSADGRCDSPRYNAKYRTYTMLDQHTDKVIDFKVVQVSEVTSSNAMEREGFQHCMTAIEERGAKVKATDGHIGIAADMRKDHPDKDHQLDVWHFGKRINIKLTEKAKKKDCAGLFPWIKSISNHLWWCAETCEHNMELLRQKWISIIHNVANIHLWNYADIYHRCSHPPIPPDVARTKCWLRPGSPAHDALKDVVLNKKLLKDIHKLTLCCHTGSLEVFHSVQTNYVPKRQHFSYEGMVARIELAALNHNANTGREQARSSKGENEGELKYKIVFPKRTKEWVAKPAIEKTTKDHLRPLLDAIIARNSQHPHERSAGIERTHISPNIAS